MEMAPPCMEDVFCQQDETALSIRKYAHLWNGGRIIWEQGNQSDPVVLPLERKYCSNWPNIVGFFFKTVAVKLSLWVTEMVRARDGADCRGPRGRRRAVDVSSGGKMMVRFGANGNSWLF